MKNQSGHRRRSSFSGGTNYTKTSRSHILLKVCMSMLKTTAFTLGHVLNFNKEHRLYPMFHSFPYYLSCLELNAVIDVSL